MNFVPFVFLVMPVLTLAGCHTPPARAEAASAVTTTWRSLGTWAGRGSRQTESFDVMTGAMRLRWETRAGVTPGHFRVSLHSSISGRPLQVVVDQTGSGSNTAYLEDEPRVSYLVIESENLDWTASLEEALATTAVR
jgi:hypothetical protein